jgi:hypothetical protein
MDEPVQQPGVLGVTAALNHNAAQPIDMEELKDDGAIGAQTIIKTVQSVFNNGICYLVYNIIYISYRSRGGGSGNVGDVIVGDIGDVFGAGTGACDRPLEC